MKKTRHFHGIPWDKELLKMMLLMKLGLILILTSLQVSATTYSQELITVDFKNVRLERALKEVEHKSDYRFVYSSLKMPQDVRITFQGTSIPVREVVDALLDNTGLRYQLIGDRLMVITRVEEAPPRKIIGKVTNEKGDPLANVTVQVKGTETYTLTDSDGAFQINVDDNAAALVFSYIDMETQEVSMAGKSAVEITMKPLDNVMEDVVVVGYGTKTKATLTGSVFTVDAQQLANRPTSQVLNSLQGLVPGLVIHRVNAGRVGNETIGAQIRGISSRSDPGILVVIDGVPEGRLNAVSALNNINPNDIESITVLKDAQAAIYGSRAAGGVMLVTTKRGKTQRPVVEIGSNATLTRPGIYRKQLNILQTIDVLNQAYANDGFINNSWSPFVQYIDKTDLSKLTFVEPGPFPDTHDLTFSENDWMDIMWGSAVHQNHNVSVSGRTDRSNYFISVGMLDQPSMLKYGTNYNRKYNARLKYSFDVNNWMTVRTNVSLLQQEVVEPTDYDLTEYFTAQSFSGKAKYTNDGLYYGWGGYLSAIGFAEVGGNRTTQNNEIQGQFEMVIKPIKNLEIIGQYSINRWLGDASWIRTGFDSYAMDGTLDFNSNLYWGGRDMVGADYSKNNQTVANLYANYKVRLGDHSFDVVGGLSNEQFQARAFSAYRNGDPSALINNELVYLGTGSPTQQFNNESKSANALNSAFSRLSYDYVGKYMFEGNFRYDASSRFAPGHRSSPFFGASVAWVFTKEDFAIGLSKAINYGKLRLSWGQLGNQAGIGNYDYIQLIADAGQQYPFGDPSNPTRSSRYVVPSLASSRRSWEKIETKNIGLDLAALDHRLSGSFDYFFKNNKNMFYNFEFPSVLGIAPPSINGAKLRTTGWELMLNWKDKIGSDVGYMAGFVLSNNASKVLSLADSRTPGYGHNSWVEGYPVGSFFTYQFGGFIQSDEDLAAYNSQITSGIPTNLRTGDVKFKDLNGDGKLTPILFNPDDPENGGDLTYIGNNNIQYSYSVTLGIDYKGFFVSTLFQGIGRLMGTNNSTDQFMYFRNPLEYYYNQTWTPERPNAKYPILTQDAGRMGWNYAPSNASYMFFNAAYLRLKNLQIGYTFPMSVTEKIHVQKLQVYLSGSDLAEWSGMPKGFEVERPYAIQITPYPRTYTLGLNITL